MIKKTAVLIIGAAGYVLGAKAGRGRYEQIKTQADKVWNNPKIQRVASDAQDLAAEKATAAAGKASSSVPSGTSSDAPRANVNLTDQGIDGIDLIAAASTMPDDKPRV
ncbi:hypothetical protein [Aeromicrobium sp.]|uniref:hypothetical protein n=1 Tax=Aeromicrobium sp. TaxID=1871063 RepID=UPI0019B7B6AD|nr:hypothetical protein [Aeromicrobium sp.]MBC7632922.1 hypothetical protein [Aeromicrobium sp.]